MGRSKVKIFKSMICVVWVCFFTALALAACDEPKAAQRAEFDGRFVGYTPAGSVSVIKDDKTGCEYLVVESNGGAAMSPRWKKFGPASDELTIMGCR